MFLNEPPIITQAEVLQLTGWTEKTLADKVSRGKFPKKISWSRKNRRLFSREQVYRFWNGPMDKDEGGFKNA